MNTKILSAAALYGVLCVCGCTSQRDFMKAYEERVRQKEEAIVAARARPLPPIPKYPDDAQSAYDTSALLMVIGNDDVRSVLAAALEKAGCQVLYKSDTQTAEFHTPDLVLCPSLENKVVHGDGASWCQVRLVISTRRSIRLDKTGNLEQMAEPRIFQTFARVKMPDTPAGLNAVAAMESFTKLDLDLKMKMINNLTLKEGKEGLKIAIDRLMRIDAFRREIAKKRNP